MDGRRLVQVELTCEADGAASPDPDKSGNHSHIAEAVLMWILLSRCHPCTVLLAASRYLKLITSFNFSAFFLTSALMSFMLPVDHFIAHSCSDFHSIHSCSINVSVG